MGSDEGFIVDLLLEQILDLEDGEFITYSEMSALAGVDIQFENRHLLDKALMIARENHNVVFENKRNVGYEKLSDADVIKRLKEIDKIRRTSVRGREKLATVAYDSLDPILQVNHNTKFILLTVFGNLANEKTVRSIEAKLGDVEMRINLIKAIDIVKESIQEEAEAKRDTPRPD
jgi:hypothetical protein